jgi:PKD repeat protein
VAAPVASFTGTPTSGKFPLTVTFTEASTNSPTSWYWTFGDGSTSTAKSPSHTYSAKGTYTVSLKVTNAGGSNTLTRTGYITVQASKVTNK